MTDIPHMISLIRIFLVTWVIQHIFSIEVKLISAARRNSNELFFGYYEELNSARDIIVEFENVDVDNYTKTQFLLLVSNLRNAYIKKKPAEAENPPNVQLNTVDFKTFDFNAYAGYDGPIHYQKTMKKFLTQREFTMCRICWEAGSPKARDVYNYEDEYE